MAFKPEKLMADLDITIEEASDVIAIVRGHLDPLRDDRFRNTQQWAGQCYNPPSKAELKMEALNELLCGCGVEAIEHRDIRVSHYHGNTVAIYVNFGDTYIPTVLYDTRCGVFRITSWGDFYESLRPDDENADEDGD